MNKGLLREIKMPEFRCGSHDNSLADMITQASYFVKQDISPLD